MAGKMWMRGYVHQERIDPLRYVFLYNMIEILCMVFSLAIPIYVIFGGGKWELLLVLPVIAALLVVSVHEVNKALALNKKMSGKYL